MSYLRGLQKRRHRARSGAAVTLTQADYDLLDLIERDPSCHAKFWFDVDIFPHQAEVCESVCRNPRTAVRSGNSIGKSAISALIATWWLTTRPNSMVVTTAPTFRQVKAIIWREIHSFYQRTIERLVVLPSGTKVTGCLGPAPDSTQWMLAPDWMAIGVAARNKENFQGLHPKGGMLVILDEGSGMEEEIFDGAKAITTGVQDRIVVIGNPTRPEGSFHRIFNDPQYGAGWHKIHIDSEKLPWIARGEDPPVPGLVSCRWIDEILAECGGNRNHPLYQVHVKGNFPDISSRFLLTLAQAQRACEDRDPDNPLQPGRPTSIGCDIARGGRSLTTITRISGNVVEDIQRHDIADLVQVKHIIRSEWEKHRTDVVVIDADGLGSGVYDMLRAEKRVPAVAFRGNAEPSHPYKYVNARAEAYYMLADDMIEQRMKIEVENGPLRDKQLIVQTLCMQLAYIEKKWHKKDGRLMIMSKDEMAEKDLPSPDEADSLMMARWGQRRVIRLKRRSKATIKAGQ